MKAMVKGKVYFNLSPVAITFGGTAVYAWEVCHRLMRLAKPLQVIPYTCPFKTLDKSGFPRLFNALLRDTIWDNILAGLEADEEDYFIFPTPDVPKKFYNRKYAMVIHDIAYWYDPSITTWGGRVFVRALPESTKSAHRIVTVSDYTAKDISKEFGIPIDKIVVAPNGLSEIYKFEASSIQKVNGIDIPSRYFLHVGKFDPKKNLSFLIKVYERFRELSGNRGNTFKLLFTGGQSNVKADVPILKQIRNSRYASDILVLGQVTSKDLPALYKGATAFVFPSTFEGFGIPVIEALSQGTPTLVNANTSLSQFSEFGATVINNFDINDWANKLKEMSFTNKKIAPSYISKAITFYDWDRTAKIVGESIGIFSH